MVCVRMTPDNGIDGVKRDGGVGEMVGDVFGDIEGRVYRFNEC